MGIYPVGEYEDFPFFFQACVLSAIVLAQHDNWFFFIYHLSHGQELS